jgi:hypothetical protein
MNGRVAVTLTAMLSALVLSAGSPVGATGAIGASASVTPAVTAGAWRQPGFDAGGSNFNPTETSITTANVSSLTQLWRARGRNFVSANGMLFTARSRKLAAYSIAACAHVGGTCEPSWVAHGQFDEVAFSAGVLYATVGDGAGHGGVAAYDASGTVHCAGTPTVCKPLWAWFDTSGALTFVGYPKIGGGLLWVEDTVSQNMSLVASHLRAFDIAHHTGCDASTCAPIRSIGASLAGSTFTLGRHRVVVADQPGRVTVYDARTGAKEWRSATKGYDAMVVASAGMIYVADQSRFEIEAYPADGGASCSGTPKVCAAAFVVPYAEGNAPTLAATPSLLFVDDHTDIRTYDAAGVTHCFGTPRVCQPLTTYPGAGDDVAPTVAGGVLYSANQTSIDAYDATGASGCDQATHICTELWTTSPQPVVGSSIEVAGGLVYATSQNDAYVHVFALAD